MVDDLDALTASLRADPRNPLTIQALADWLEEKGAAPESVRALTVEGPTVLVFSLTQEQWDTISEDEFNSMRRAIKTEVGDWLTEKSGHPVKTVLVNSGLSIRAIKATVREKGAE